MNEILESFKKSFLSFMVPQVWWCLVLPMLITIALGIGLVILFWSVWFLPIQESFAQSSWIEFISTPFVSFWASAALMISKVLAGVVILSAALLGFHLVGLLLISNLLVPLLLPVIIEKFYKGLRAEEGGSFSGSILNTVFSLFKFSMGYIISIPFWIIPGAAFFLTSCWNGYLVGLVFPYDILQKYASREELRLIRKDHWTQHFSIGVLTSMLFLIPGLNLLAPSLMALVFIHYDLTELSRLRKINI